MKQEVTLYTREGCHLCEKAKKAMESIRGGDLQFEIREVDIDTDPELVRRYGNDIPVITIGGREIARHRVDPERFRAALQTRGDEKGAASDLAGMTCVPCRGGVPPMASPEIARMLQRLGGSWDVVDDHHLHTEYRFPDFRSALAFTNAIGEVAEEQGHHPDLELSWGRVGVKIWTHKIDGLTESDFVLAAKIDRLA